MALDSTVEPILRHIPELSKHCGLIDGTIHRIRCPYGPLQAKFYCGDKRCHFISSQIVVDADFWSFFLWQGIV